MLCYLHFDVTWSRLHTLWEFALEMSWPYYGHVLMTGTCPIIAGTNSNGQKFFVHFLLCHMSPACCHCWSCFLTSTCNKKLTNPSNFLNQSLEDYLDSSAKVILLIDVNTRFTLKTQTLRHYASLPLLPLVPL